MSFETSKFGNGVLVGSGGNVTSNVHNHYGPRDSGKTVGVVRTAGAFNELAINFDGEMASEGAFPLGAFTIPKGAIIKNAFVEVYEAFDLGGTTPAIEIGTEGSEATNGVTIDESSAEAIAAYDVTSTLGGTWAAPLAADTVVGIALSGTTPTSDALVGRAKLIIQYALAGA